MIRIVAKLAPHGFGFFARIPVVRGMFIEKKVHIVKERCLSNRDTGVDRVLAEEDVPAPETCERSDRVPTPNHAGVRAARTLRSPREAGRKHLDVRPHATDWDLRVEKKEPDGNRSVIASKAANALNPLGLATVVREVRQRVINQFHDSPDGCQVPKFGNRNKK